MANPWAGIMAGAGQAIMAGNDYLTSEKRDKIMKMILERRARQQEELDAMLMEDIGTMRAETPEAERAEAMSQFVGQLRDARATQPQSYGARGQVSDREAAALTEMKGGLGQFADREADITSRIDSQGRMRQNQGLRLARTGTDMQEKIRLIESADFLDQLRLARARKNPWLDMLGEGLKGAGQAMGGGMGGMGGGGGASAASASSSGGSMSSAKGG